MKLGDADQKLVKAINEYYLACVEEIERRGHESDDACMLAMRETMCECAGNVLTIMMLWSASSGDDLTPEIVEPTVRLLLSQIADQLVSTLPDHIASVNGTINERSRS